ncbi:regulation of nuclear pre-mRNA domain-containing protein 2 isoform X2 [Denticeps clupeoides]|uniref:regulation of nuclear pre-mRNA domain-containing protein 2 isoform X2 n=1 Tax=Denticeps clupeoides TaxID=299321 RepID=UPI0010A2CD9A|nr:regulation of nuclear pre-mRNA domain-containing protein 2 isoform X2 [Denticeps clupeoides]
MATGPAAASSGHGGGGRGSAALESSLDRRFQGVTNTMESIQGLSAWCIENKKHHGLVVRSWMKWLKKSDTSHRLNLFYLANDVVQNCKRKNAIVFRTAFAEVLPNAALLVRDGKVRKSVERIFSIWQERNVYPEELITELKICLTKKEQPPPVAPNPKTVLKSKIVAEFAPQSFIEQLVAYQRSLEEVDLRQKQLAAFRVDVCSTEGLKQLKDKAGGKKFSADFEEGSSKLQEFVTFLEGQLKAGPPVLEALNNADVFYEMQYKEVKIVANAYRTYANRVSNLKRKLDALKATLPDLDDSPIPSPSEDAPSPTGSESPFHGMGIRGTDGKAMDQQKDNRDVQDMDLSEEEDTGSADIIVEDRGEKTLAIPASKAASSPIQALSKPALADVPLAKASPTSQTSASSATPTPPTPGCATVANPGPLQVNLANVDLGKISSILSSITSAMKSSGVSPAPRPSPGTPSTPSSRTPSSKPPAPLPSTPPPANPLASILSRVDITPEGILSALSKTQAQSSGLQGLSSLLHTVAGNSSSGSQNTSNSSANTPTAQSTSPTTTVTTPVSTTSPKTKPSPGNAFKRDSEREWEKVKECEKEKETEEKETTTMPSLDSKIHKFLQGNPAFSSLGLDGDMGSNSPLLVGENVDGTPVRDETAGTPTQDEIMDKPGASEAIGPSNQPGLRGGSSLSPTAYNNDPWDAVITPREILVEEHPQDGDYRSTSSRFPTFGAKPKKHIKGAVKHKEEEVKKRKESAASSLQEPKLKVHRKASSGSEDGSGTRDERGKKIRKEDEQHFQRIETLVSSSCGEGAPIQTLGYNRRQSGERIQTVESIRVIGRDMRRGSGSGPRTSGSWYEEEEFRDVPPPGHSLPGSPTTEASEDLSAGSVPLAPPPPVLIPPQTHARLHLPPGPFPMPYASEDPHQHPRPLPLTIPPPHPPPSPFFPPIPQPPPPREFLPSPSAVMVGGVLVPIDRVLPYPPSNTTRSEAAGRGGSRGAKPLAPSHAPRPLMTSLLGEPPKLPRPGTVKDHFNPRHAPPLHRPGTPGPPPPLLGRIKEGPGPTSTSPASSTPPSPTADTRPILPSQNRLPPSNQGHRPPASPPTQPQNHRRQSPPVSLLHLPSPRLPMRSPHANPPPQRPFLRGQSPLPLHQPPFDRKPHLPGAKRPGPAFTRLQGGSFPPKRPFLPPRY